MHNPHTCVIKQGFSRELRLLTPDQFRFVFEQPSRASTPTITILSRPTKLDVPRLGLTVAKKHVKRANRRNRIKRICRESFRLKQQDLPCCDFVVIAKKGIDDVDNQTLYLMLEKLWQRLIRISPKA